MGKTKIRFVDIIYWLAIIGADIIVYIVLGVLQMDYDDNYDSSKGEYWSLASMNTRQLIFLLCIEILEHNKHNWAYIYWKENL